MSAHSPRPSFLEELKRRKVLRVAYLYVVGAVATAGAADLYFPRLGLPPWTVTFVIALAVVGFPLALALGWAYQVTPEGLERQRDLDRLGSGNAVLTPYGPPDARTTSGSAAAARGAVDPPAPAASEASASPAAHVSGDPRSVAVLPFSNLSPDPRHAYFADGMTEDVLAHLGKVRALRVTSRTSVMRYRETTKSVREIAAELGVGAVLEGSIRATADRVRVVAQLIDARTDTHLWTDTYDRDLEDIFAVQSEVAESVAQALEAELSGEELEEIREPPTEALEAYGLSLEAETASRGDDPDGYARALGLLEAAVKIDPTYARAHADLASLLTTYPFVTYRLPPDCHDRLAVAVDRALELDPDSGHAWAARGLHLWCVERDWLGAEAALARALELDPEDEFVLERAALHAYMLGRFEEADSLIRRMEERDALTSRAETWKAMIPAVKAAFGGLDFEPAFRLFDDLIERKPDLSAAHLDRGAVLVWAGRTEEGLEAVEASLRLAPDVPIARGTRGWLLALLGRTEEALAEEAWFREAPGAASADPYCHSLVHFGLGHVERGFDLVEKAVASRSSFSLPLMRLLPGYRGLWGHPRFAAIMHEIWPGEHERVLGEYGWRPEVTAGAR